MPDLKSAAITLVKQSIERWRQEEDVIDDTTAIIFNLSEHKYSPRNINGIAPAPPNAPKVQDSESAQSASSKDSSVAPQK